ncbi:anti-sigma factor antagonist [bacterium]|nr:anti-sigma factor antagonist [bacterium]
MIMRAKQDGKVVVFELEGHLEFESTVKFQEACEDLLTKQPDTRLVFNFQKLKFVGSSGINHFITTMKELLSMKPTPKMIHVSTEFDKIFNAYRTAKYPFPVYEDLNKALIAFETSTETEAPKAKKKKKVSEPPTL